jgi:hypothetical protein
MASYFARDFLGELSGTKICVSMRKTFGGQENLVCWPDASDLAIRCMMVA